MRKSVVDLNSHVNQTHIIGNPADFPLTIVPAQYCNPMTGLIEEVPNRHVVTRADTGRALSVVSNRYALVPHTSVIETIDQALEGLDVGPVPRGIYMTAAAGKWANVAEKIGPSAGLRHGSRAINPTLRFRIEAQGVV